MKNSGIILINKPKGFTSRQVDNYLMNRYETKKVGHLGTLDPFASGLLVIALNEGTKILPYLKDEPKVYIATFKLGEETSSLDYTEEIIKTLEIPHLTEKEITPVLQRFIGKITQYPPRYSAIKVEGKPLYHYVRKGIPKDAPPREVTIFDIKFISYEEPLLTVEVTCSRGTYIRTLGKDIAYELGTTASTLNLKRTHIGKFNLDNANELTDENYNFIDIKEALLPMKSIELTDDEAFKVKNGAKVRLHANNKRLLAIYNDEPLAILEKKDNVYITKRGFVK